MKVERSQIEALITKVEYHVRGTLTTCYIDFQNGWTSTGESACIDPAEFKKDVGEKIAYEMAFNKMWGHLGYAMLGANGTKPHTPSTIRASAATSVEQVKSVVESDDAPREGETYFDSITRNRLANEAKNKTGQTRPGADYGNRDLFDRKSDGGNETETVLG